jgi:hypothetical protein
MGLEKLVRRAFEHLNLRRNPFGEAADDQIGKLAVVDVDAFIERVRAPGFVVEFLGHCGRGKTTHMRAIWEHFSDAPFVRVAEQPEDFRVPDASLVFVDEAQFLSRRQRRRLFSQTRSYVVGTHKSLAPTFRRAKLDFETVSVGTVDKRRLCEIIERRIEWARRADGPAPSVSDAAVDALIAEHQDNLRAVEHHLYDVFQTLEEICHVQVRHLS